MTANLARALRMLAVVSLAVTALVAVPAEAHAADKCEIDGCLATSDGLVLTGQSSTPDQRGDGGQNQNVTGEVQRTESVSTLVPACPGNDPNLGTASYDAACAYLVSFCATAGRPGGVLTWIWTRTRGLPNGAWSAWLRTGQTCDVGAAAAVKRPALTRGVIQQAFARLVFSKPQLVVQPKGGTTLVNLPTYFEVTWPEAGVQPTEVAKITLLGRTVQIRPRVTTYDYAFGDGGSLGPTVSRGGPYPSGDVVHSYVQRASTSARAMARYSGDYSLDGGATWTDIGLVVPVQGPDAAVRVLEARNQLVAGGG